MRTTKKPSRCKGRKARQLAWNRLARKGRKCIVDSGRVIVVVPHTFIYQGITF